MIGGEIGRPVPNSTGPGHADADRPTAGPGIAGSSRSSESNSSSTRSEADAPGRPRSGPARRGGRGSGRRASSPRRRCSSRRGRRRGRGPPSARKVSWRGGRPPVLGPDVALDDEAALDELADPLGDDRPAEAGPVDELGARPRSAEPDLVEDERRARRAPRRAAGRGWRARSIRRGRDRSRPLSHRCTRPTFALDRSKYDAVPE